MPAGPDSAGELVESNRKTVQTKVAELDLLHDVEETMAHGHDVEEAMAHGHDIVDAAIPVSTIVRNFIVSWLYIST